MSYLQKSLAFNNDHLELGGFSTESANDKKKTKNLKRYWNQLSKCQRSCILSGVAIMCFTNEVSNLDVIGQLNQGLEESGGAEVDNNVNRNQVLVPPRTEHRFVGPTTPRQQAIVKALKHAWKGYKKFAWGT
ncbi:hypothetical protein JTB14_001895 [Gonioctena quinquepunctata]|nr:hypothetical protein JTB14_001895 [Gonioctena quinquepunctata]